MESVSSRNGKIFIKLFSNCYRKIVCVRFFLFGFFFFICIPSRSHIVEGPLYSRHIHGNVPRSLHGCESPSSQYWYSFQVFMAQQPWCIIVDNAWNVSLVRKGENSPPEKYLEKGLSLVIHSPNPLTNENNNPHTGLHMSPVKWSTCINWHSDSVLIW